MAIHYDYTQPSEVVRPGETYQIGSIHELTEHLGVFDPRVDPDGAPSADQMKAITTWLKSHEPGDMLRASLHDHGLYVRAESRALAR